VQPGAIPEATLAAFREDAIAAGFDEVLVREWPAGHIIDTHTHPFALRAIVARGEMWLTVGGETRHLRPGDIFALERDVPHAERYGAAGTAYWVARRN
jgi:mannose-6-phosphate isomerase-like protein (cupin superfamily)